MARHRMRGAWQQNIMGVHRRAVFHLTATTTGAAQTVTIDRMTPATGHSLTIQWGDGNSTTVSAGDTTATAHVYATAASYGIQVTDARNIVQIDVHDAKLSGVHSSELAQSAITRFYCYSIGNTTANVIDSADMASWTPTNWYLYSMPSGTYAIDSADMVSWTSTYWRLYSMPTGTYAIDSADMASWTPTNWWLHSMPSGTYAIDSADMASWTPTYWYLSSMPSGTYAIDSADMASWTPTYWWLYSMPTGTYAIDSADMASWSLATWYLHSMPTGTYAIDSADMTSWTPTVWQMYSMPSADTTWTLAANDFAGFVSCTSFLANDNALNETQVNALLYGMYQATLSRTVTGGTIDVGGTNTAPSGTFQACASCPVDAATPGKEVAHELLNDICDAIAAGETWATVTITA